MPKLVEQTRLPRAGLPDYPYYVASAFLNLGQKIEQLRELALSSDKFGERALAEPP